MPQINPDLILYAVGKMRSEQIPLETIQNFLNQHGVGDAESIERLKARGKQFEDDPTYRNQMIDYDDRLNQYIEGGGLAPETRELVRRGIGG